MRQKAKVILSAFGYWAEVKGLKLPLGSLGPENIVLRGEGWGSFVLNLLISPFKLLRQQQYIFNPKRPESLGNVFGNKCVCTNSRKVPCSPPSFKSCAIVETFLCQTFLFTEQVIDHLNVIRCKCNYLSIEISKPSRRSLFKLDPVQPSKLGEILHFS